MLCTYVAGQTAPSSESRSDIFTSKITGGQTYNTYYMTRVYRYSMWEVQSVTISKYPTRGGWVVDYTPSGLFVFFIFGLGSSHIWYDGEYYVSWIMHIWGTLTLHDFFFILCYSLPLQLLSDRNIIYYSWLNLWFLFTCWLTVCM